MRQIAIEAGADPTLVSHFHGTKQELFLSVIELPFQPADVLPGLLAGDPQDAGARLARFVLGVFESEQERSQIVGLVMARYIVALEPFASRGPAAVAAAIAPSLGLSSCSVLYKVLWFVQLDVRRTINAQPHRQSGNDPGRID